MRVIDKILKSVVEVTILILSTILLGIIFSAAARAEGEDSLQPSANIESLFEARGMLKLDCKAFVKSHKPRYTHRARQVTIECVDLAGGTHHTYTSKSGKLSLEFALDTRYLVYVSKEGYETKMLAFSTKGANPTSTYEFDFDLLLEKTGKATYDEFTPSTYIVYNRIHKIFLYKRFLNKSASNR